MNDIDVQWDNILRIKTTGRDDSISDLVRYPYEPTNYAVLEQVANSGYITKKNTLLDYGCGKGRVSFCLSYLTKCHAIGVEYNPRLYERAKNNQQTASSAQRVILVQEDAADFAVPMTVDRAFFFNPFSVEILKKTLDNLRQSQMRNPRDILLCFYYPSPAYTEYLNDREELALVDTLDCQTLLNHNDPRENVLIYKLSPEHEERS